MAQAGGFFITGSDTGVGKTWVACQIIRQLKHRLQSLKVRKPVESGCQMKDKRRLPADGLALYQANDQRETLNTVTPFRLLAPIAPDQAAQKEGVTLTLAQLEQAVWQNTRGKDFVLVEGAGGFFSPIAQTALNADLAQRLALAVIIVIEDRLGAINQALLTINAVESRQLAIAAVILNRKQPELDHLSGNMSALAARIRYPLHVCPYREPAPDFNLYPACY